MRTGPSRRWSIRIVRADGRHAHTLTAGRAGALAGVLGLVVVMLGMGVLLGRALASRTESERVATLTARLRSLQSQMGDMSELSSRLQRIEQDYARIQAAVTEGAPSSGPSVMLPAALEGAGRASGSPMSPAWPLAQRGFITRSFGSRAEAAGEGHPGIDIAVPSGSYVRAMRPGVVDDAGEDDVYGRFVRIAHGGGISSLYGHNSWLFVQPGDSVMRLQVIALSGSTGRSTAPHLHFEITRDGVLLDPLAFVNHGGGEVVGGVGQAGVAHR